MPIDIGTLTEKLVGAGKTAASDIWRQIEHFAVPEMKKIAVQIEALADPASPWSLDEKKLLLRMQVRSAVAIIVAMTSLTMLAVQNAINAILATVRDFVNGAIGIALL
jgi:hypothetical protein